VDRVAFEDPGYDETGRIAAGLAGLAVVRVRWTSRACGWTELAATGAGAVVVTPAHQWPTGVVLSPAPAGLADWARRTGGWVVEDDYDAEFRYDREPVGAVQGLAPDRVVTIGTVSKSLAPALRLGWLLCPDDLVDPVADLEARTDRGSPGLDQLVLARLIESGRFDRHLRRMRRAYAARREVLVRTLAERAPAVGLTGLAAGFHAVARLPAGVTEAAAVEAGPRPRHRPVRDEPAPLDRRRRPGQLVLGFGNLSRPRSAPACSASPTFSAHRRRAGLEASWEAGGPRVLTVRMANVLRASTIAGMTRIWSSRIRSYAASVGAATSTREVGGAGDHMAGDDRGDRGQRLLDQLEVCWGAPRP
jgi:DNA-binding transcriptional MocR family regulator